MPLPASDHPARAKGRQEIADLQRALVAALTAEAGAPQGFNHTEVARTARSLRAKRRAAVAKAWPGLTSELGATFAAVFDSFAAACPVGDDGPVEDGRRFAEHLWRRSALGDRGRSELLARRVSRGMPLRAMRLSNGSIAIALRLRRGIRRIVIPVPFVARPGLRIRERAR
jgi:hypothetical protein